MEANAVTRNMTTCVNFKNQFEIQTGDLQTSLPLHPSVPLLEYLSDQFHAAQL